MKELEQMILSEGRVLQGEVLKVDGFLNHRINIPLFVNMGKQFATEFNGDKINKIITVEASGIGLACITAQFFGNADVVYAKKSKASNQDAQVYCAPVFSFTHNKQYNITVAKQYLDKNDRVLIIDDFLARGEAVNGLMSLCEQAGATVCGVGIAIEKGFQGGGDKLRAKGVKLRSLAVIESMSEQNIVFRSI